MLTFSTDMECNNISYPLEELPCISIILFGNKSLLKNCLRLNFD